MKYILLLTLGIIGVACAPKENLPTRPTNALEEEKFIQILTDIHLVDAASKLNLIEGNHINETRNAQFLGVLKLHQTSLADFDSTLLYYSKMPQAYDLLYEQVITKLKTLEEQTKP